VGSKLFGVAVSLAVLLKSVLTFVSLLLMYIHTRGTSYLMLVTPYVPWKLNKMVAGGWPALNIHNEITDFIYDLKISSINLFTVSQDVLNQMTEDQRVAFDSVHNIIKKLEQEDGGEDYIDRLGRSYDGMFSVEGYDDSVEYVGKDDSGTTSKALESYVSMDQ
jgi:hypothetical protein